MNLKEKILKEALPSDKDYSTQRQEFIRKAMKRVGLTAVNKIRKSEDQENSIFKLSEKVRFLPAMQSGHHRNIYHDYKNT